MVQRGIGVGMLVVQLIRTAALGSHFQHFTSWNWTLTALYILLDSFAVCRQTTFTLVGPMALASALYVAYATVYMFCYSADVVVESYADYGLYTVIVANFILHFFDVAICMTVYILGYYQRRLETRRVSLPVHLVIIGSAQLIFMSAYFYFISAQDIYGFHTITDATLSPLSVFLGVVGVECIVVHQYYYGF